MHFAQFSTGKLAIGPIALLVALLIGGCADIRYRSEHALKWQLENEAAKRELDQQGFPQYTPGI